MFAATLAAGLLAVAAPVPKDVPQYDIFKEGQRLGRVDALVTWTLTLNGLDDESKKVLEGVKEKLVTLKKAVKERKLNRDQLDSLQALEVSLVGILEIHLAGQGKLTESFKKFKEELEKEREADTKK